VPCLRISNQKKGEKQNKKKGIKIKRETKYNRKKKQKKKIDRFILCFSYTILLTRPRRGDGIDHSTAVLFYITHMNLAGAHIIYGSLVVVVVESFSHHWDSLATFSSRRAPDGQGAEVHLWRFLIIFPAELAFFISPPF
jgi:hypothetical protein